MISDSLLIMASNWRLQVFMADPKDRDLNVLELFDLVAGSREAQQPFLSSNSAVVHPAARNG